MRRSRLHRAAAVASLACITAVALTGCAKKETSAEPAASGSASGSANAAAVTLIEPGKLKVCTGLPYKPFEFKEGGTGAVVGFDIDIMDALAKKLNAKTEVVDIPFEQISSGLVFKAKKCDVAAAGMTITPERQKSILFSDPYFDATQALMVKKSSPVKALSDLRGKVLGVQTETTGQIYANKEKAANGYETKIFKDLGALTLAVKSGSVDAIINDNGVLYDYLKDNPDTAVVKEFATGEQYGIGSAQGDENAKALIAETNKIIAQMKTDGSYEASYKKWFGTAPTKKS